jgi:ribosomal protein S18 acetylase RimI-like enzyme
MVIVVPPNSPAIRYKNSNAAEIHLLGVLPEYRRQGLGRSLIESAISQATNSGYLKLVLWTQQSMNSAHRLYESAGFIHIANVERNGRNYKVYERSLQAEE